MMKFLLLASYPDSILKFRKNLIIDLQRKGFDVHVAAPNIKDNKTDLELFNTLGVTTHKIYLSRTGMNPLKDLFSLICLFFLMRRIAPDFVLCYTIKPIIYGVLSAKLAGIKNIIAMVTGVGIAFTDLSENRLKGYVKSIITGLYTVSLKLSSKIIFQNTDDYDLFISLGIVNKDLDIAIVNGSGVDLEEFRVSPFPLGLSFLIVSRLLVSKGIREFVEAARILKKKDPNAQFTIVGWVDEGGDSIKEVEVQEWVDEGVISFLGRLDDVRPALVECSVFVLPSYREGTPRSVLEAMAMGRPIITSDAPGCRETVTNGVNGFLVEVKNVESLVSAMQKFKAQPSLISIMGKCSRALVCKKYDVKKVNVQMMKGMGIDTDPV